ncbi:type IV secretion system protein [Microvirgula aerodenitrificans]|uniref:type IV secretion system protein n=1 Tax=Microvirgula aerodenitrificans TaxID=57480 RepID=UPI00248D3E70|nr:type IV secretion system protein [Microvirgula aerodenitrificans]
MDPQVFQFIGMTVQNATDAFVQPAATNLMSALQMVLVTGVALYITLTGYAISTGAVESPFMTFMKQCVKIIIISFFALTADGYVNGVMGAFNGLESGLAQAMQTGSGSTANIYQLLDQSMGKGFELVGICFQRADEAGWNFGSVLGWAFAGLVMATGTVIIAALGGAVVIVAKFALGVVFALGPLFIASLLFPATARFFDSWFSQVMNYILTIVIMAIIMTFAMKAFNAFIGGADLAGEGESNPVYVALQVGALCFVLGWIIQQAGGMATGLAGGVSMSAMGIRHLMMPAKGAYNMANPMTTRRDMQSGMMVTARRGNHMVAGNTMWNPAYRQHVMSNMGKNWGKASGGSVSG